MFCFRRVARNLTFSISIFTLPCFCFKIFLWKLNFITFLNESLAFFLNLLFALLIRIGAYLSLIDGWLSIWERTRAFWPKFLDWSSPSFALSFEIVFWMIECFPCSSSAVQSWLLNKRELGVIGYTGIH